MTRFRLPSVLVALILIVACGTSTTTTSNTNSNNPFRVLMIVNLTGSSAYLGQADVLAYRAASKFLNKTGGILNRQITIDYVDSQGDPTKAVSLLAERINSGTKYDFCECGTFSAETLALLSSTTKAKLLTMAVGPAAGIDDPVNHPYHFGYGPQLKYLNQSIAPYVQKQGYKKAGILISTDAAGLTQMSLYQQQLSALGIQPITQQYTANGLDFTAELEALRSKQPDVVVFYSFGPATGIILRNRAKLGWNVPFIADNSTTSQDLTTLVSKEQLNGVTEAHLVLDVPPDAKRKTSQWQTMYDTLQAEGPLVAPLSIYSRRFDALIYIATAAKQAGSTDPDKIRQTLESLKTPTPIPWLTFAHPLGYSSTEHFVVPVDDDFAFTGPTHLDNGLAKPI
jgi:branched-chain amino acid transport system substrate-binding protein